MRFWTISAGFAAALTALPVQAAPLSVQDLLTTYNVVTSGNLYSSQEVEGRVYVGGDLTGTTIQTGFVNPLPPGPAQNVVVKGNSTIGTISGRGEIVIGGNANTGLEQSGGTLKTYVGDTHTGLDNFGTVTKNLAGTPEFEAKFPEIDFAAIASYSQYLATLSGTTWTFADINNKVIPVLNNAVQAEGTDWIASKVTVLYTTFASLVGGGFSANVAADETVIINVAGTSGSFDMNALGGTLASAKNILWNFYQATDIEVKTKVVGSILAPYANMGSFAGSTEGSVIAKSVVLNNGELHLQPFRGDLPKIPGGELPPAEVPLPAGLPLLIAALGALGLARRRA